MVSKTKTLGASLVALGIGILLSLVMGACGGIFIALAAIAAGLIILSSKKC